MIFPVYGYKEFNNENQESHPKKWSEMLMDDYLYCKNLKNPLEGIEKIRYWLLPSYHPYWKLQIAKDTKKDANRIKEKILSLMQAPSQSMVSAIAGNRLNKDENLNKSINEFVRLICKYSEFSNYL